MQMHLLIKTGIPAQDGVSLLLSEEKDRAVAAVLRALTEKMEAGEPLGRAMERASSFPRYASDMVSLGEQTGNLDKVLFNLSGHYDRLEAIAASVKSAALYPAVMLVMMLCVAAVLISLVLPIFNDVFNQLGAQMSPLALTLMRFGLWLRGGWVWVAAALLLIAAAVFVLIKMERLYAWRARHGLLKAVRGSVARARFASGMAMTMAAGLDAEQSLEMAGRVSSDLMMKDKARQAVALMREGLPLAQALSEAGIFGAADCRLVALGFKVGEADRVMLQVAERCGKEADERIARVIGGIEPTLVVAMSVLVGVILLSVLLPLMGIMRSM